MLAALAASGLAPPSARFGLPEITSRAAAPESSGAASSSASGTGVNRRRSLRLSAKKTSTAGDTGAEPPQSAASTTGEGTAPAPSEPAESEAPEPAPSETVVNDDEFAADFTDDEVDVDAEVCLISHCR